MSSSKQALLDLGIRYGALQFGQFTLKSGRQSPYFFNSGVFHDGLALQNLGKFYAQTLQQQELHYNVLFGPAYKGIPLVTSTAVALQTNHDVSMPIAYNRKEAKQHGEGGQLVGAELENKRVVIIDDVLTAGTALKTACQQLHDAQAKPVAVIIILDRQERGSAELSTTEELAQKLDIPIISLLQFQDIIAYVEQTPTLAQHTANLQQYREHYAPC